MSPTEVVLPGVRQKISTKLIVQVKIDRLRRPTFTLSHFNSTHTQKNYFVQGNFFPIQCLGEKKKNIYMGDVACCLLRPDEVMGGVSVFPFTADR